MVALAQQVVLELGFLAVLARGVVGVALVALAVLPQVVDDVADGVGRFALDHRPIRLGDLAVLERLHHAAEALGRLGVEDDAADRSVDAVDGAKPGLTGLVVLDPQVFADDVVEGAVVGDVALDDVAGALVDRDDVVVLVQDLQVLRGAHDDGHLGLVGKRGSVALLAHQYCSLSLGKSLDRTSETYWPMASCICWPMSR